MVLGARLESAHADPAIEEVLDHSSSVGGTFSWWVSPADAPADLTARLIAAGLVPDESSLAMACRLADLADGTAPDGVEIERVRKASALLQLARIHAEN